MTMNLNPKTVKYLLLGGVFLLFAVAVLVYWWTGDSYSAGAAGAVSAAASAAAGKALNDRQAARVEVASTKEEVKASVGRVSDLHNEAQEELEKVTVSGLTDQEKIDEGNQLLS